MRSNGLSLYIETDHHGFYTVANSYPRDRLNCLTQRNTYRIKIPHKGFVSTNIMFEHYQSHYEGIEVKGTGGKSSKTTLETRLSMRISHTKGPKRSSRWL